MRRIASSILLFTVLFSCSGIDPVVHSTLSNVEITSSNSIDTLSINKILEQAGRIPNMYSLLISKENEFLIESYFNENEKYFINNTQSVTKTVVALLYGIAIDKKIFNSSAEKLGDHLFPVSEKWKDLTIDDLISMNSGIRWNENQDFRPWISSENQIDYVLNKSIDVNEKGKFNYNSGGSHLAAYILSKQLENNDLQKFAVYNLFYHLGIKSINWQKDKSGNHQGSTGLSMSPLDMLNIGKLLMDKGNINGKEIVPGEWIDKMTTGRTFVRGSWSSLTNIHYGRQIWTAEIKNYKTYFAWGYGGQFIFVIPGLNSVIVSTAKWMVDAGEAERTEAKIIELICGDVINLLEKN
ncbi:MAG: beta-lactamase family protein [Melioribacteraceae bacterium]|nr:beta-lactamase family protein [Melioribacteraceae bacterium]MCF8355073.1 beta-lactamase family protein [Melioribacteraceae bacterium]MCF8395666.1 beta-lactamase family protein [Melioribacteraceae bacterium]MCF8420291.1 beta-lactamase family protein [Melioribacteraceae bacterium]